MTKKYFSEFILITYCSNIYNLIYWLDWHLNIINFEHGIVIINNTINETDKKMLEQFYNKIELIIKPDRINQSAIYTEYVNKSKSYWVLPIDDDEYLYISDKYEHDINKLLFVQTNKDKDTFYKYAFNWLLFYSNELQEKFNQKKSYLDLYRYVYLDKVERQDEVFNIKTIVNTSIYHQYFSDYDETKFVNNNEIDLKNITIGNKISMHDHIGTVHNPLSKFKNQFYHAKNLSTNEICAGYKFYNKTSLDMDCFIAHYKYRTLEEFQIKTQKYPKMLDVSPYYYSILNQNNFLEKLYEQIKSELVYFPVLYNLFNKYKNYDNQK